MNALLGLARAVDALNQRVGRFVYWLVLAAVLISAGNAIIRKTFNTSSNAWLEIQWYLFAAVFLLGAGHVLLLNEHVRIDVIASRLKRRTQVWIDVVGLLVFVLPLCVYVVALTIPITWTAYVTGEMSTNAGGLVRWPSYLMMPIGFVLLGLQSLSELIKRVAFLRGLAPDPAPSKTKSDEELLLEDIRKAAEAKDAK